MRQGRRSIIDGRKLRMLRLQQGLTQAELADAAGVSRSAVNKIENGSRDNVTVETLKSLARVLQCPVDALLVQAPIAESKKVTIAEIGERLKHLDEGALQEVLNFVKFQQSL